jgi:hypothetical protein
VLYARASRRCTEIKVYLVLVLLIVFGFIHCELAFGETFNAKCEKIKDDLEKAKCPILNDFSEALSRFMKIKNEVEHTGISVEAGYNGDKSSHDQRQLINLSTSINKEIYPIAFRFKAGTVFSSSSKDNKSQDQVTTFLVNLDYNVVPWLKTYGFVERFTDTFMNIKERYETGVGVKFELDVLDPAKKPKKDDRKLPNDKEFIEKFLPEKIESLKIALAYDETIQYMKDAGIDIKKIWEFIESVEEEADKLKHACKKQRTKINLGLAITAMSEMEQAADLSSDVLDINTKQKIDTLDYPFSPTQRYRVVFRPSILLKINDHLSLYYHTYFKEPLGGPVYDNGRRDWRADSLFDTKIDLTKNNSWGGEASVILEYQSSYDNAPPYILSQKIDELMGIGKTLKRTAANKRHDIVLIKIGVKF